VDLKGRTNSNNCADSKEKVLSLGMGGRTVKSQGVRKERPCCERNRRGGLRGKKAEGKKKVGTHGS